MVKSLLIDECISIHFRIRAKAHQRTTRSIKVLGAGTPDNEIAEYAEKHQAHIITADIGFAKNQVLIKNRDVYFVKMRDGSLFHIKVRKIGKVKTKFDLVTHHIRRIDNHNIILP